jgi:hypothetical protein
VDGVSLGLVRAVQMRKERMRKAQQGGGDRRETYMVKTPLSLEVLVRKVMANTRWLDYSPFISSTSPVIPVLSSKTILTVPAQRLIIHTRARIRDPDEISHARVTHLVTPHDHKVVEG